VREDRGAEWSERRAREGVGWAREREQVRRWVVVVRCSLRDGSRSRLVTAVLWREKLEAPPALAPAEEELLAVGRGKTVSGTRTSPEELCDQRRTEAPCSSDAQVTATKTTSPVSGKVRNWKRWPEWADAKEKRCPSLDCSRVVALEVISEKDSESNDEWSETDEPVPPPGGGEWECRSILVVEDVIQNRNKETKSDES
jgi:hypothetical protein